MIQKELHKGRGEDVLLNLKKKDSFQLQHFTYHCVCVCACVPRKDSNPLVKSQSLERTLCCIPEDL